MSTIAVVGLGYVGLPLAVAFGRLEKTIGFDLSAEKIRQYQQHHDPSGEVSGDDLQAATHLTCTTDPSSLAEADYIIVAVPTPVDAAHQPDFSPLINASRMIGRHMKRGALVIYESTVYPGATEEVCIPVLEEASGYKMANGFQRRLLSGAHQSGRQGAQPAQYRESGRR